MAAPREDYDDSDDDLTSELRDRYDAIEQLWRCAEDQLRAIVCWFDHPAEVAAEVKELGKEGT